MGKTTKIGIICSKRIESGFGLSANRLLKEKDLPMLEMEDFPVHIKEDDLARIPADYYIAIGIHSLPDEPKRFTVHPCGNWDEKWQPLHMRDDLGGDEKKLSGSSAELLKFAYCSLKRHNTLPNFKVDIEATHHGPNITKPILMLEIGSNRDAWEDKEANRIIVEVVDDIIANFKPRNKAASIVLGGEHYMTKISKLLENEDESDEFLVSHMCPSNQINSFTEEMLLEAIEKSKEPIKSVVMDLEGIGQHAKRLTKMLQEHGMPCKFLHELILSGRA